MLSMITQTKSVKAVICVQVNLFVETIFVQVNLFVETVFVKVNPLMLISFRLNLFSLTIPIMLIHQYYISSYCLYFFIPFYFQCIIIQYNNNIFTNLLLAIVILLSKSTCLREFFIMFILRNSTFLRFSLDTNITFQSCRTMLLLKTEVSFLPIVYVFLLY